MSVNIRPDRPLWPFAYSSLIITETLAAGFLFWTIFPLFQTMMETPGQVREIPGAMQLSVIAGSLVQQACYWTRYHHVAVPSPFKSAFLGHVLVFCSRASFFFSGALFSVVFFRHIPQLDTLPSVGQSLPKAMVLLVVLFSQFCYSLEVERLGRAFFEGPAAPRTR